MARVHGLGMVLKFVKCRTPTERAKIHTSQNLEKLVCFHERSQAILLDRKRHEATDDNLSSRSRQHGFKENRAKQSGITVFNYSTLILSTPSAFDTHRWMNSSIKPKTEFIRALHLMKSSIVSNLTPFERYSSSRSFSSSTYSSCHGYETSPSSNSSSPALTHVDCDGQAKQVDVSPKPSTFRTAVAEGVIKLTPEVSMLIAENRIKKGDVLNVAKISSILGSKQVANLIPLCHPVRLDFVDTTFHHNLETNILRATSTAKCYGNTGVEMEALTACTIALLTVYDMCKAVSQTMVISDIRLVHKSGGKTTYDIDNGNQI